jgi:hypothetical protein|tara:strand:+ start:464 stop:760 length:297 start_codon:yes stop_codon:yes gene_type:complete
MIERYSSVVISLQEYGVKDRTKGSFEHLGERVALVTQIQKFGYHLRNSGEREMSRSVDRVHKRCTHLLTAAGVKLRVIETTRFLKDSAFFDPPKRRKF